MSSASNFEANETLNYDRLRKLVMDDALKTLRSVFDTIHPPDTLAATLADPKVQQKMRHLQSRNIITSRDYSRLYPTPATAVNSKNFDTSLLMVLLRNICKLRQPRTGWDELPRPTDHSTEADIARIKYYRNKICHSDTATVDVMHFQHYWDDIGDALVRLGANKEEINKLKTERLDPTRFPLDALDLLGDYLQSFFCAAQKFGEMPVDITPEEICAHLKKFVDDVKEPMNVLLAFMSKFLTLISLPRSTRVEDAMDVIGDFKILIQSARDIVQRYVETFAHFGLDGTLMLMKIDEMHMVAQELNAITDEYGVIELTELRELTIGDLYPDNIFQEFFGSLGEIGWLNQSGTV